MVLNMRVLVEILNMRRILVYEDSQKLEIGLGKSSPM